MTSDSAEPALLVKPLQHIGQACAILFNRITFFLDLFNFQLIEGISDTMLNVIWKTHLKVLKTNLGSSLIKSWLLRLTGKQLCSFQWTEIVLCMLYVLRNADSSIYSGII